jgi:hypothetical protein
VSAAPDAVVIRSVRSSPARQFFFKNRVTETHLPLESAGGVEFLNIVAKKGVASDKGIMPAALQKTNPPAPS